MTGDVAQPGSERAARVRTRPVFSFVLPVFNEQPTLAELLRRLGPVADELGEPTELIFVDDGSTDGSYETLCELARSEPRIHAVRLSRNFGHQAAITAGLDLAEGDAIVVMDSDLQHPPELVPELVARWREGFDVVYAIRSDRSGESWLKRRASVTFYRLLRRVTRTDVVQNAGDFRLIDRRALLAFRRLRENNRYLRGMFSWLGFRQTGVPYGYHERHAGVPKYTFRRMVHFGVDGVTSFSNAPLHLALHLGFAFSIASFLFGTYAIVAKLAGFYTVPGWAGTVVASTFLGGVQLLVLGVIGLYIGRMYDEVKRRPIYVISEEERQALAPLDDVPSAAQRWSEDPNAHERVATNE
jgi:glycosyltransferase involved in cell wall biosynthesis